MIALHRTTSPSKAKPPNFETSRHFSTNDGLGKQPRHFPPPYFGSVVAYSCSTKSAHHSVRTSVEFDHRHRTIHVTLPPFNHNQTSQNKQPNAKRCCTPLQKRVRCRYPLPFSPLIRRRRSSFVVRRSSFVVRRSSSLLFAFGLVFGFVRRTRGRTQFVHPSVHGHLLPLLPFKHVMYGVSVHPYIFRTLQRIPKPPPRDLRGVHKMYTHSYIVIVRVIAHKTHASVRVYIFCTCFEGYGSLHRAALRGG